MAHRGILGLLALLVTWSPSRAADNQLTDREKQEGWRASKQGLLRERPPDAKLGALRDGGGVKTIGVISDTHGPLRPEALAALHGSDLIVHAGDIGSPSS